MRQTVVKRTVLFSLLLTVSMSMISRAEACQLVRSENYNALKNAELVLRGPLLAELQFVKPPGKLRASYYRAKILVTEMLVGAPNNLGTELDFVFYKPINRKVKGLSKDVDIIVGLRKPREREGKNGRAFIDSTWFSVAPPCDSLGVIVVNGSSLEDIKRGIRGEHKRRY